MDEYQVGVTIVNWNNYEDTSRCLASLERQNIPLNIYLVDNGSTDESVSRIRNEFEDLEIIANDENLGFPAAINQGFEAACRDGLKYNLVVNNDVIFPHSNAIRSLKQTLEMTEEVGIVSALIRTPDGEVWFEKGIINWTTGMSFHASNTNPLCFSIDSQYNDGKHPGYGDNYNFNNYYVPLCAVLFDISVYKKVGPLPQAYFLYYEDVEYCTQIKDAGFDIVTDKDVVVYHKESASSGGRISATASYYTARNHLLFLRRHADRVNLPLSIAFYICWLGLLTGFRIMNRTLHPVVALLQGAIDGARDCQGKGRYPVE